MIDKMIADLREEEAGDIKARDFCTKSKNKLDSEKGDLEYQIKKSEEEIERLEAKKGELEKAIAEKEVEEFRKALKDDTDAVALIGQAIDALTAFYKNNKLPLELTQEDPKYTVDEDKAPEANFGGPPKSESK